MSPLLGRIITRAAARDTIDKKWIDRLRKTWKDWVKRAGSQGAHGAVGFLQEWGQWIKALSVDMAFSKGFFTFLRDEGKTDIYEWKVKAMEHLQSILTFMGKGMTAIQFWDAVITPGTSEYRMGAQHRLAMIQGQAKKRGLSMPEGSIEEVDAWAKDQGLLEPALAHQVREIFAEIVARTDAEFSRQFLAFLTRIVNKFGPIEWGSYEREFHVGDVKVFMVDLSTVLPQEKGESRLPSMVRKYVEQFQKAQTLLERKGLGYLWYGPMFVACKSCGGENPHGMKYGVGAHYLPSKDQVTVYQDPVNGLYRLIAHELGHRYYYKFMSIADRARFSMTFGDVPAVSEYGGSNAEEDFAEVFSYYIDGKDLTPEQIIRFKQFLGKRKKASFPTIEA